MPSGHCAWLKPVAPGDAGDEGQPILVATLLALVVDLLWWPFLLLELLDKGVQHLLLSWCAGLLHPPVQAPVLGVPLDEGVWKEHPHPGRKPGARGL